LLVLFSDVDALYTKPPTEPGAAPIPVVAFGQDLSDLQVSGTSTGYGTGGALTKLAAAQLATAGGVGVLLTSTSNIDSIDSGDCRNTWFEPADRIAR
jgi:glutamate 5-kinase